MSFLFHRNNLKATSPQKFDAKVYNVNGQAQQICSDLRSTRALFLDHVSSPSTETATIISSFTTYASLLQGLITAPDEKGGESKLRFFFSFRWTNSAIPDSTPVEQCDALFELINITFNLALWHMKRAAFVAAQEKLLETHQKEIHRSLRMAAGIFKELKENQLGRLLTHLPRGSDGDQHVLSAYINQCLAEAQEVTFQRAVELKHAPTLLSALAFETSNLFEAGMKELASMEEGLRASWRIYLQMKQLYYLSQAYCYLGQNMLAQEKCGDAIRAVQEARKFNDSAVGAAKDYNKAKSRSLTMKPLEHPFFHSLKLLIARIAEKCERENAMIFHQKVSTVLPQLDTQATFGLAVPEPFTLPPIHPLWTAASYAGFDLSARSNKKFMGMF